MFRTSTVRGAPDVAAAETNQVRNDRRKNSISTALLALVAASTISGAGLAASTADPFAGVLDHMYNLEFGPARRWLETWTQQHPEDLRAWNYLAESILDQEMLREGLLSTGAYVDRGEAFRKRQRPLQARFEETLFAALNKAQELAEQRLARNPRDADALYWAGVQHGTRAEFYFALERKYVAAAHEGVEARRYKLRLARLDPAAADPLLILGLADYALGSLPWYVKVFLSVAGLHGNRARGLEEMERASRDGHWAREDAKFVLVAIYRREKMYRQALADLDELARSYPRNYLLDLERARIFKDQGDWRSAAQVYDGLVARLASNDPGGPQLPAAKILYQAGQAYEHLGDLERALRLYTKAGNLPGDSLEIDRALLAAAAIEARTGRMADARRDYQRVAAAVPDAPEGRSAASALKDLH